MKKLMIINLLVFGLMCSYGYAGSGILKQFVDTDKDAKLFVGIVEEKQKQLEALKKERDELLQVKKAFDEKIASNMQENKVQLDVVEADLKKHAEDEFLLKKQTLIKEIQQALRDTQRIYEDYASLFDEFIVQLETYIEDPQFEGFRKKNKLQDRLYYSFEDLQNLHELILGQERLVIQLTDQEKSLRAEKESTKRSAAVTQDDYEKRKQEIKAFAESGLTDIGFGMNIEHEKELLQLEERFYKYKIRLDEVKLKEIEHKIAFLEFQLFGARSHLDIFKKHVRVIKPAIYVNEADVAHAEEELMREQHTYFSRKDTLRQQREKVANEQKALEKMVNELSKKLNVPLGRDLDDMSRKPKQTVDSYNALSQVGATNAHMLAVVKEKELLDMHIALEDEKYNYKRLRTDAKKTYHKITTRRFLSEDEITRERAEYDIKKKDTQDSLKLYQTKINTVTNELNAKEKVLDNIKTLINEGGKQKDAVFKEKAAEYNKFIEKLTQADEYVKKQIDGLGKLTGIYSGIISELNSKIRLIDFISAELQASTIWYRPAYAITMEGIKNIIPDAQAFFNEVRLYITQLKLTQFISRVSGTFVHPVETMIFLVILLVVFLILLFFRRVEDYFSQLFFVRGQAYSGVISVGSFILGTIITFVSRYYLNIFFLVVLWLVCELITDTHLFILFYLFSIPYLIYLSHRFIKLLIKYNEKYNYVFLPEDFQRRFELVFSILLYVSITIFFFRQAFMFSTVNLRSELPNILLAVNWIILQISLIFLITKEQILGIIPEHRPIWKWIKEQVDQYYYLILAFVTTIIIMMNPYVGFGRLVLYLLWGLILSGFLLKGLSLLHGLVKRISSFAFFSQEEAVVRERFSYAKTWFGLVIIASFVVLGFIGFILAAKIWGWEIGFADVRKWLEAPILLEQTTHPVSTLSLLKIIFYVLCGFIASYALKLFVLARIFDLLLVESGVQHTVTSIIQYIVITIAVFIGFQSVGLGVLIGYLFGALAFSIGLYIKDPISDFISYFIILVQRPVKVGDFIEVDPTRRGVVRKITPRSVILRKKNSTTIIVPNSYLVSNSIENWNYVRNFIAFGDIDIVVSYKEDAQKVKELLFQAVESHPNVLKNPRPIIRLEHFGEIGYEFMIRGFISSAYTLEMWDIASDVRLLVVKVLREHKIELALPVRRVIGSSYYDYSQHTSTGPHADQQSKESK